MTYGFLLYVQLFGVESSYVTKSWCGADEKRHIEAYQTLVRLFETIHIDNMKILKALIYAKDDLQPLFDGTGRKRVML